MPDHARSLVGKPIRLRPIETNDPCLAVMRARAIAARSDARFLPIETIKNGTADEIRFGYSISTDFGSDGSPPSFKITDVSPDDDPGRINFHIRAFLKLPLWAGFSLPSQPRRPQAKK